MIAELTQYAAWEPPDSARGIAMLEAAAALRRLAPNQASKDPSDDPAFHAESYQLDTHVQTKELRIAFYAGRAYKGLLGYLVLASPEIYDLSIDLMKHYDKLEGIE